MPSREAGQHCPFSKVLADAARTENPGLRYRDLMVRIITPEDVPTVFGELQPHEQKALASAYVSEAFWREFESRRLEFKIDVDEFEPLRPFGQELGMDEKLSMLYSWVLSKISRFYNEIIDHLGNADPPNEVYQKVRQRLNELLKSGEGKSRISQYLDFPEEELSTELNGAFRVILGLCILIDELYRKEYNKDMINDQFEATVLSSSFVKQMLIFGNVSEWNACRLLESVGSGFYFDPKYFILSPSQDGSSFTLQTYAYFQPSMTDGSKVRCPALDLDGATNLEGRKISVLEEITVWFLRQLVGARREKFPNLL